MTTVDEALKASTVEGVFLRPPGAPMDKPLYAKYKAAILKAGGTWKGGKTQAFQFDTAEEAAAMLTALQGGERPDPQQEYQFFPTPTEVSAKMMRNLDGEVITKHMKILEPEAGKGALIWALWAYLGFKVPVDAYEVNPANVKVLETMEGVDVIGLDFLKSESMNKYDLIIANPPFTKGLDIDHVMHMYMALKPGGILITLTSPSWTYHRGKKFQDFKLFLSERGSTIEHLPAGMLADTNISPIIVKFKKPKHALSEVASAAAAPGLKVVGAPPADVPATAPGEAPAPITEEEALAARRAVLEPPVDHQSPAAVGAVIKKLLEPVPLEEALKDPAGFVAGFEEVGGGTTQLPPYALAAVKGAQWGANGGAGDIPDDVLEAINEERPWTPEESDRAAAADQMDLAAGELRREFPPEDPYLAELGGTLETEVAEVAFVDLDLIDESPTNPRRHFDDEETAELAASLVEHLMIQPVLLRPHPTTAGRYELVAGARRIRASRIAVLTNPECRRVPSYIRQLTDDQALEMQITENLQRKDPHPMEEAYAFKALLPKFQTVEEMAARLGKKVYLVRQRLRLNDLIEPWQKALYKDKIHVTDALRICQQPTDQQAKLFKSKVGTDEDLAGGRGTIAFTNWDFNTERPLFKAAFDKEDPTLNPKMGACVGCPFNTATAALFPEDAERPLCTNGACFEVKTQKHLDRQIKAALKEREEGQDVVFINRGWGGSNDGNVKALRAAGEKVLDQNHYQVMSPSEPSTLEELKEHHEDELASGKVTLEQLQGKADAQRKKYDKEMAAIQKKLAAGVVKKAVVVAGDRDTVGHTVYVVPGSSEKAAAKKAVEAGAPTREDLTTERNRIKGREKRSLEIDQEKIHARVDAAMKDCPAAANAEGLLSIQEMAGVIVGIHSSAGDKANKWLGTRLGVKGYDYSLVLTYAALACLSYADMEVAFRVYLRKAALHMLAGAQGSNPEKSGRPAAMRGLALQYIPDQVGIFDAEQAAAAEKRGKGVAKRLADVERQIKELPAGSIKSDAKKGKK